MPAGTEASTTTTLLISDIVESTRMLEALGDRAWLDLLRLHNALVREQVERHRGFEVKTVGDGFMIAFSRPELGVGCAIGIQRALADHNRRYAAQQLKVRIGVHVGETIESEDDLFGREVVAAVRIGAHAGAGEILVSERLREIVEPTGLVRFDPGRLVELKGLRGRHRVHRALWDHADARTWLPGAEAPIELRDRDGELEVLDRRLAAARAGAGAVVVVSGPPGIGKSALLETLAVHARDGGVTVLAARAEELDAALGFGLVRRLLQPTLARLSEHERAALLGDPGGPAAALLGFAEGAAPPTGGGPVAYATLAGLVRVAANLAADGPLAVVVDDAQWADDASLAWVEFLGGQVAKLPLLLVVGARAPRSTSSALDNLPATDSIELQPLGADAVTGIVTSTYGSAPDPRFCAACLEATGGNPFYLLELLRAALAEGVAPDARGAGLIPDVGPEAVQRMVVGRLTELPEPARALARACAVLGTEAEVEFAARLAGMSLMDAVIAADALCAAAILRARRPLQFTHPIVASAVLRTAPDADVARLHTEAARLLYAEGEPAQVVATHLLGSAPAGDPVVVDRLAEAADRARHDGTPATAARYLARALREPPVTHRRAPLLLALGRAELAGGRPEEAVAQLDAAHGLSAGRLRAEVTLWLARAHDHLLWGDDAEERWERDGVRTLARMDAAIAELGEEERELRWRLEAQRLSMLGGSVAVLSAAAAMEHEERLARLAREATGGSTGEREILGEYALQAAMRGALPCDELLAIARRALDDGSLLVELAESSHCDAAIETLEICDAGAEADGCWAAAAEHARRRGTPATAAYIAMGRAACAGLRDAHAAALALVEEARAYLREAPSDAYIEAVLDGTLCGVHLAADDIEEAGRAARRVSHERLRHHALGLVLAARGEHERAAVHLNVAQAVLDARGLWRTSGPLRPVRPDLATSLLALGRREEAIALATVELTGAERSGAPSCLAEARRALGLARGGEDGLALLRGAVAAATAADARLVEARARRALAGVLAPHDPQAARHELETALDIARAAGGRREQRLAGEALDLL